MEEISSRSNPAVKEYVKLRDHRSYRHETGRFVLESHKLLEEALLSDLPIESVWMTLKAEEKYPELAFTASEKAAKIIRISPEIEQKCSLTGNAQGIFAICGGLDKYEERIKIKRNGKYLFLCNLQDTGNVGTMLRTALAFGMDGVIVSASTCDLYSIKVLRASMGCLFRLPVSVSQNPVEDLKRLSEQVTTYAAVLDPDARVLGSFSFDRGSVVVIGNEGNGLTAEEAAACTEKVLIPMKGSAESLNASMAAGILMWEQTKDSVQ